MKNYMKEAVVVSKMIGESTVFAFSSLRNDKFRTFLSLLGVAIGIFSIVAVFCAVDSLQSNVKEGLSSFGSDVVYIQESPWSTGDEGGEYKWWEYRKRPPITEDEYSYIKAHSKTAKDVVYVATLYGLFHHGRNSFSNGYIVAASPDIDHVANVDVEFGRAFSSMEYKHGANVAVIGYSVADALFQGEDPLGKTIKVKGKNTVVVGVGKKQGQSMVQVFDMDNAVIIPLNYAKAMSNVSRNGGMIVLAPKEGIEKDEFLTEIRLLLRSHRRLKPEQKDNFALNEMTFLIESLSDVMGIINTIGWVIGGFSLLIGGFGIANIMFVSVKERTNQIGIQKALGAKKYVIMTQFLVEAAVLSVAGGLVGIAIVYVASLFFRNNEMFQLTLSLGNSIKGLIVAMVIGILSGIIPAYSAAKLDPVKAING